MQLISKHVGLYVDFYELAMAQGYFLGGKKSHNVTFDYFFRTNPFGGGYLVFAGLGDLLQLLSDFKYTDTDIQYLRGVGLHEDFLKYLRDFKFTGTIYSAREGEVVFPLEPVLRLEGNIIEAQLVETAILNTLNFQSLIATKALRISLVTKGKPFTDFGLRRAHGYGGVQASRASIIGGAASTSNVYAGILYNLPVTGTLAHSWVQSFDDELSAFRVFADIHPENTVLLVDTYNTIKSGIPNAIIVAKEMEDKGYRMKGVRLDSGDLAYFSSKARKMLDKAGLEYVKIYASNQLNEYVIKSLAEQGAPIDAFGVGTELVTGKPEASLDGVYKLVECNGVPKMKISENIEKVTLPASKTVYRYVDSLGYFCRDGILLANEDPDDCKWLFHPYYPEKSTNISKLSREKLTRKVLENGKPVATLSTPQECNKYLLERMKQLPDEHKRFIKPHIYKVGISERLHSLRTDMIEKISVNLQLNSDKLV